MVKDNPGLWFILLMQARTHYATCDISCSHLWWGSSTSLLLSGLGTRPDWNVHCTELVLAGNYFYDQVFSCLLTSFKLSAKLSTESLLLFLHGCQLKNFTKEPRDWEVSGE